VLMKLAPHIITKRKRLLRVPAGDNAPCSFEEWLTTVKGRILEHLISKTEADSDLDSELRRIFLGASSTSGSKSKKVR